MNMQNVAIVQSYRRILDSIMPLSNAIVLRNLESSSIYIHPENTTSFMVQLKC